MLTVFDCMTGFICELQALSEEENSDDMAKSDSKQEHSDGSSSDDDGSGSDDARMADNGAVLQRQRQPSGSAGGLDSSPEQHADMPVEQDDAHLVHSAHVDQQNQGTAAKSRLLKQTQQDRGQRLGEAVDGSGGEIACGRTPDCQGAEVCALTQQG